jgi:hypothetical protein
LFKIRTSLSLHLLRRQLTGKSVLITPEFIRSVSGTAYRART